MSAIPPSADAPRHPIQVVARRTGLSTDVIRVWERRYRAVTPRRSDTSRRLYSDNDIERLALLRRVTQAGRRIGDVARLSDDELQRLADEDRSAHVSQGASAAGDASTYFDAALAAVRDLEPARLQAVLNRAAMALSQPVLLDDLVTPLIRTIGEDWHGGRLRVCHEHAASAQLRAFLDGLRATANMTGNGPVLLVTTPAGQNHELGALLVAVTAAANGWRPVYLNPNAPAADIAAAAGRTSARAVALSISYPADDPRMGEELRMLTHQLAPGVTLLVGGRAAAAYNAILDEIGARRGESLSDLRAMLDTVRHTAR